MDRPAWWAFEAALVATLLTAGLSQRRALVLLGISRGSWQLRLRPRPRSLQPVPHRQRRAPAWLSTVEVDAITAKLTTAFASGKSVYQAYFEAWDAADPVASLSSWYRIAHAHLEASRPVRRRARHRTTAMPQWDATGPMQVWSWDITKLKGPYVGTSYDLYVILDVFSRKIVGWRVEALESGDLAKDLFERAITDHGGVIPRIVHSDGGASMTSRTLTELFRDLTVQVSRNRPRVSNDNPYSESWFKTAKYAPTAPRFFTDLDHARAWAATFVAWYNTQHRHSSLEGHTPATVHDGTWVHVHQQRQAVLADLAAAHPERFTQAWRVKTPHAHVVLNTPQPDNRLTTG
ncbi:transposase [Knoellia sinensis KCTC 19936]|uniref:Transposase n=1 Tax=Knoellia sinensis KCTC 19936 TaxID=1385520 RepID=A0A0A0IY38_9MICO|nr:DDE-type integrase/transposase/recombinase [Knoellia sinensis]KGN30085.1 transposase [Knoellia sinensis KCTC 19936]